jgi:hypothetical protein
MPDSALAGAVEGGGRLTPSAALDVYRKGYTARLTEALGETYEACWRVLGDEDFLSVCADYAARTPSLSHNLSDYGGLFPGYLESRADLAHAPFLGDLARFEWAFKELFHRAPHAGLPASEIAGRARPDGRLRLGAAMELLSLRRRVRAIWSRDRSDDTPLSPADWEGEQRLLLYKQGTNDVMIRELSAEEHAALSALRAGHALAEALAPSGLDEAATSALFSFLAGSGLVVDAG